MFSIHFNLLCKPEVGLDFPLKNKLWPLDTHEGEIRLFVKIYICE
jgi:hypothetical protein